MANIAKGFRNFLGPLDLHLRQKLTLIGVVASLSALGVAGGASLIDRYVENRGAFASRLSTLARVIAANCTTAVAFQDPEEAHRILSTLDSEPSVVVARLHRSDGQSFASFERSDGNPRIPVELESGRRHRFEEGMLHVWEPVREQGIESGTLYLQASPASLYARTRRNALVLLALVVVAGSIASVIAYRLQRSVSDPIVKLAHLAKRVRGGQRWESPLPRPSSEELGADEVGDLVRSFHEMLAVLGACEEALRDSESNFRMITEQASDGIVVSGREGRLVSMNLAACELLGFSMEEGMSMKVADMLDPEHLLEEPMRYDDIDRGKSVLVERAFLRKNGDRIWIEANTKMLKDGRIQSILRDVSERKRLEEQLRQSQKMEVVGQLAGGIAHDFNNLLTVISGFSELILQDPDCDLKSQVNQIWLASQRAAGLTRQLLTFSRQQIATPCELQLSDVVAGLEKMLVRIIGEDVLLETVLDSNLRIVRADVGQIEQVIVNLVVNSRDAMPQGGRLRIETRNVDVHEGDPEHPNVPAGSHAVLLVADEGEGIDPKRLPHIFEPFYTTKAEGKGTGLGLSTVNGIVQQSDGHFTVTSTPGEGTTFKIYLPALDDVVGEIRPANSREQHSPRGSECVLLVEDEEIVRILAMRWLESLGYQVVEASSGQEALSIVADHDGPLDLLFSDVIMPKMSGVELWRELSRRRPDLRLLLMSGYMGDALERHGVDDELAVIAKPFDITTLAKRVRLLLDAPPASTDG